MQQLPSAPGPEVQPQNEHPRATKKIIAILLIAMAFTVFSLAEYFFHIIPSPSGTKANQSVISVANSTTINNTAKCVSAGGSCETTCEQNSLTGAASLSDFFYKIMNSIVSIFYPSQSQSVQGSVVSSPSSTTTSLSPGEIGSYPVYCTFDLPKCCANTPSAVSGTVAASIVQPTIDLNASGSRECNNNCKEFGYNNGGICWVSYANNFTCGISNNQTLRKIPSYSNWCNSLNITLESGEAIGCCCYP